MAIFPSQGGSRNTWGTELRAFFNLYFNLSTGYFKDPWIDARSYSTLALADAAAVAAGKPLLIASDWTASTAVTLSSYVKIEKGGSFTKSGSGTLAFNGGFEAGNYQVFSGFSAGDVTFADSVDPISPCWFGVKGDNATDDSAAIAVAVSCLTTGKTIIFGKGNYLTTQIDIASKDGVTIKTAGVGATVFKYNGTSDNTKAVFKVTGSSYVQFLGGMTITSQAGKVPGYGIWATGNGTVQQLNVIDLPRVTGVSVAGIQIGDTSTTNTDMYVISNPSINNCGVGVRVYGANTNLVKVTGGAITENITAGVELGNNARGLVAERILMYGNGTSSGAHFLLRKENSAHVTIRDFVTELGSGGDAPFLKVEPLSGGTSNRSNIVLENLNWTCDYTSDSTKIIDHQGWGSTIIRNAKIAGRSAAPLNSTLLSFQPPGATPSGLNSLITENVRLYNNAAFSVKANGADKVNWVDIITGTSDAGAETDAVTGIGVKFSGLPFTNDLLDYTATPAGVTHNSAGYMGHVTYKATIAKEAWTAAATTQDIYPFTLPAKAKITSLIMDTTEAYAGLAGTIQIAASAAGYDQGLITAHDVKTATVTKGLLDADLGTNLVRANVVQGGYINSWTGTSQPGFRLTSGTGNLGNGTVTNLTAGSITIYLTVEILP